ncbi:MAG: bifunctional folylpolyglutamate synthase/dihydrofolate synthase [Nitrospirales bacterium]|nr:bifunctional folylpolyglutamate synthase/dihydrofolate synthase [Nitrospirales bacterium]
MAFSPPLSIESLFALRTHGIKLGLDTIQRLLVRLNHPQLQFVTLHIGGTNGKGSTAAITASILQAAGYRVGLYTSPHLIDFRERIRVQGRWIPEDRVFALMERIQSIVPTDVTPTFFEFTTAMAFQYFAEEQVEVAVVEVGMGGRFDATNVVDPMGVVITNVGLDHEAYLGQTLADIAYEKAGIVKPHVPLIAGPMDEDAWNVVQKKVLETQSPGFHCGVDFSVLPDKTRGFHYQGLSHVFEGLSCALDGAHQWNNAGCALALLEIGMTQGLQISEEAIRTGLSSVAWEGRLETIFSDPRILLDGAHNPAAAQALARFLRDTCCGQWPRKIILGVSMMKDKDHSGFLKTLVPLAEHVLLIGMDSARGATAQMLFDEIHADSLRDVAGSVSCVSGPGEALVLARDLAGPQDRICFTGSLFLVGSIKNLVGTPESVLAQE